jgi:hypothetical protein
MDGQADRLHFPQPIPGGEIRRVLHDAMGDGMSLFRAVRVELPAISAIAPEGLPIRGPFTLQRRDAPVVSQVVWLVLRLRRRHVDIGEVNDEVRVRFFMVLVPRSQGSFSTFFAFSAWGVAHGCVILPRKTVSHARDRFALVSEWVTIEYRRIPSKKCRPLFWQLPAGGCMGRMAAGWRCTPGICVAYLVSARNVVTRRFSSCGT